MAGLDLGAQQVAGHVGRLVHAARGGAGLDHVGGQETRADAVGVDAVDADALGPEFERELVEAVKASQRSDAPTAVGDWCRWCTAKPICPSMTGAIDRVAHQALKNIDNETLGAALQRAEALEAFIADARALAQARLEKGMKVPGYKLVSKRATRQWANELDAAEALRSAGLVDSDIMSLNTPAQIEKVCKKLDVAFPTDQVVSVSSGNTLAPESDKRPAVLVLGEQLRAALNRVQ